MAYKGLTINSYLGDAKTNPHGIEVNSALISTVIAATEEPHQGRDGFETYDARKVMKVIRLQGRIVAPSYGQLNDLINSFGVAFDPALGSYLDPDDHGFDWFTFIGISGAAGTETGYQYWARPQRTPEAMLSQYAELNSPYSLSLICSDPARYTQALTTTALTGATVSGDYPTWPEYVVTMTGAGAANFTIRNAHYSPVRDLVLNLTGRANGQVVRVIPKEKKITVDGVDMPSLYVSGDWDHRVGVTLANISLLNAINATADVEYRKAYSQ